MNKPAVISQEKLNFIQHDVIPLLEQLDGHATGHWGVMNGQQMVEHLVDSVRNASGKLKLPLANQGEELEKARAFLLSEKPFRENTKNPLLGPAALPLRRPGMESALQKLRIELDYFFAVFEEQPQLVTLNPVFGELDYSMNVQLLHKHMKHHLRQFGLLP